jgi:hypothetical protein
MFRQLQVHTPAPLTPDRQCAADRATETFNISLTPAKRQGHEAGTEVASGSVARSTATLGATAATAEGGQSDPYDSSADDDL